MKTVISERSAANAAAAEKIRACLSEKDDAVMVLTPGENARGLYDALVRMADEHRLSFRNVKIFLSREFEGTELCRRELQTALIDRIDLPDGNFFFPDGENVETYDALIGGFGGADVAVTDIGGNGRLEWNEPGTPFDSLTHVQRLAPATRRELAERFGGEENVPQRGITVGIKTVTAAREIIVPAFGSPMAEPVFKMLYGRNDSVVPAAFLQLPVNVTVYLDPDAAEKL